MPKFHVSMPHPMTQADAVEKLQMFLPKIREHYGDSLGDIQDTWEGNLLHFAFTTLGMKIKGTVTIEEKKVTIDGDLPLAAMMFKGKIESVLKEQMERVLR